MARPVNQIAKFRASIASLLDALSAANSVAKNIDYLGGIGFCRPELEKVDAGGQPVHDITPAQMTAAIGALTAINALLEDNAQAIGKALARMKE